MMARLAPVAGTVPVGSTLPAPGSGVQLVAAIKPLLVPPSVRTVMVGRALNPLVSSIPVTVMVTVLPPLIGSGVATAVNVGGVVSTMKVPVAVLGLPA